MADTQRRFAVMGANTFKIADKIMSNQRICRLLKYQVRNPFSPDLKDVDGAELINKQILIVPKIYDGSNEKMSYVTATYDEWLLDDTSLRPYLIMEELDIMFNQAKLSGIGNLQFHRADALTLSPQIGGYSMRYKINEFN